MAVEMSKSKLGQEQINMTKIAEKKKELCQVPSSGNSDKKKVRVWDFFFLFLS